MEGKEMPKLRADCCRLVGGRLGKQGNLHAGLVLGNHRSVVLCTHCQNLKGCTETLSGFIHVYCSDGLSRTCLSRLLFRHSVISHSLCPCGLQHTRLPCPSSSPRVCSNSCLWGCPWKWSPLWNTRPNTPKGRERDRTLWVWVQLEGQQAVLTTPQWPPPRRCLNQWVIYICSSCGVEGLSWLLLAHIWLEPAWVTHSFQG